MEQLCGYNSEVNAVGPTRIEANGPPTWFLSMIVEKLGAGTRYACV